MPLSPLHRAAVAVAALLAWSVRPALVRADDSLDACSAAAVDGQKLRRDGHLLRARDAFEACARESCRADIAHDCQTWLAQVDAATPSLLVTVRDEHGRAVGDAAVTIDGEAISPERLGRSFALDPGEHVVTVARAGSQGAKRDVVLHEGERIVEVALTLAPAQAFSAREPKRERVLTPATLVTGSVAAAALVTFGVLATIGYSDWNRSDCSVSCDHADATRVHAELTAADIALAVGVFASAVTAGFYFWR